MKDNKQQSTRIRQMEQRFVHVSAAVKRLSAALDRYESVQEPIADLKAYFSSDVWRQDYADDEAGLLPEGLKRGVLSEDGIWNLLSDVDDLNQRLQKLAAKT